MPRNNFKRLEKERGILHASNVLHPDDDEPYNVIRNLISKGVYILKNKEGFFIFKYFLIMIIFII